MSNIENANAMMSSFNNGDWAANRGFVTDDSVYIEHATGRKVEGGDAWIENSRNWKAAFTNATGKIVSTTESGNMVVQEIVWNGTMDGDMTGPDGSTIPATGKTQTTPAVMVMTFKDGKVAHCNHYFDMMSMMVQLGLAG